MSTLRVNAIQNTSGVQLYLARAWVNFDGTTGTIRASGNVSSITRNGTGDYTVNFTNAMPDANYAYAAMAGSSGSETSGRLQPHATVSPTASALRVFYVGQAYYDAANIGLAIFR